MNGLDALARAAEAATDDGTAKGEPEGVGLGIANEKVLPPFNHLFQHGSPPPLPTGTLQQHLPSVSSMPRGLRRGSAANLPAFALPQPGPLLGDRLASLPLPLPQPRSLLQSVTSTSSSIYQSDTLNPSTINTIGSIKTTQPLLHRPGNVHPFGSPSSSTVTSPVSVNSGTDFTAQGFTGQSIEGLFSRENSNWNSSLPAAAAAGGAGLNPNRTDSSISQASAYSARSSLHSSPMLLKSQMNISGPAPAPPSKNNNNIQARYQSEPVVYDGQYQQQQYSTLHQNQLQPQPQREQRQPSPYYPQPHHHPSSYPPTTLHTQQQQHQQFPKHESPSSDQSYPYSQTSYYPHQEPNNCNAGARVPSPPPPILHFQPPQHQQKFASDYHPHHHHESMPSRSTSPLVPHHQQRGVAPQHPYTNSPPQMPQFQQYQQQQPCPQPPYPQQYHPHQSPPPPQQQQQQQQPQYQSIIQHNQTQRPSPPNRRQSTTSTFPHPQRVDLQQHQQIDLHQQHLQQFRVKRRRETSRRYRLIKPQIKCLSKLFEIDPSPSSTLHLRVSQVTGMPRKAVRLWFQNARAKLRREARTTGFKDPSTPQELKKYQYYIITHGPPSQSTTAAAMAPNGIRLDYDVPSMEQALLGKTLVEANQEVNEILEDFSNGVFGDIGSLNIGALGVGGQDDGGEDDEEDEYGEEDGDDDLGGGPSTVVRSRGGRREDSR
ncbi:UNVERIFIED_CONTAM: hypothetical protein HDU68_004314 [Siphonaria sp. JEL0065]|nr:hypothetical protein HDU68_004314 [Siphonaria sp. JEL0065]